MGKSSTGSGSGFKASQKMGQRPKVSSDRLGEAGSRTCNLDLQDMGLSPTQGRRRNSHFETNQVKSSHEIQFINIK